MCHCLMILLNITHIILVFKVRNVHDCILYQAGLTFDVDGHVIGHLAVGVVGGALPDLTVTHHPVILPVGREGQNGVVEAHGGIPSHVTVATSPVPCDRQGVRGVNGTPKSDCLSLRHVVTAHCQVGRGELKCWGKITLMVLLSSYIDGTMKRNNRI